MSLDSTSNVPPELLRMTSILIGLAFLPFLLGMLTSFAKIVVVCGILRQGLGLQQVPPTSVLTGLALVLTITIMAPVATEAWNGYQSLEEGEQGLRPETLREIRLPIDRFLKRNVSTGDGSTFAFFEEKSARLDPLGVSQLDLGETWGPEIRAWSELLTKIAPAFLLQELSEAFLIGFLLLIPFLVLDLVVGNVLLSLGMMMMSPQVVSLPLKILLFVSVDGWELLLGGLIENYVPNP